jgi:hypothetical protein
MRWRNLFAIGARRVRWSSSEAEWQVLSPSVICCTKLDITEWNAHSLYMRVAIRPTEWFIVLSTVRGERRVPPLRFAPVGMTKLFLFQIDVARARTPAPTLGADYLARAKTSVTSSGCSLAPIQSSTAAVTISLIRGSGKPRFSRNKSISRCSPNSPKSFSGSVTPSL